MPLVAQKATKRVILGLMTFGEDKSTGARITDLGEFNKILDNLQARGYNEVDTARAYVGRTQESFTRRANWKDRGLTLATKVIYPASHGFNTAPEVAASVETSLKELGTDSVDILYLHAADRGTPFAETLEAIDKLHKAGKFVTFGISNYTSFEVAEIVMTCKYNGWVRPTVYQAMYNAITRSIEAELVPACRRYGLDIVTYNPIAGGLFSGKVKSPDAVPTEGRFSDETKTGSSYRQRYFRNSTFESLQLIEKAAEKHGISLVETALRWIAHHSALKFQDGNDGVIIGISNAAQLEENLNFLEKGPLPDDVLEALDNAWLVSKAETANYFHGVVSYSYDTQKALFAAGAK